MLRVVGEDGVEDPGEAQDRVDHHDEVVDPDWAEGRNVAEEFAVGVGLEEGEIHKEIPNCCPWSVKW